MAFWWCFGQKRGVAKGKWWGGCKTKMTLKQHQDNTEMTPK